MQQVAQLLWAGNGSAVDAVSGPTRTAPSAGGLYPVELYLVAGNVEELKAGIYSYDSSTHTLEMMQEGDVRSELTRAALGQYFIEEAPMTIVIAGVYERTTRKYGDRGRERYVKMDAGHAAENIFLQVTALELGTTTVGAFRDRDVKQVLGLRKAEPLYIMPVGKPEG
jgi:SagB-type dehydrogenase family enzyme